MSDFWDSHGRFSKIGFYVFLKTLYLALIHTLYHWTCRRNIVRDFFFWSGNFWVEKWLFWQKNFVVDYFKEGNTLELWNVWGWAAHIPKQWTYRGINDHEGKSFFEKKLCRGSIWKKGLSIAFKLGGMITYTRGSRLLKKNSRLSDFCENYGFFSKIGLYDF